MKFVSCSRCGNVMPPKLTVVVDRKRVCRDCHKRKVTCSSCGATVQLKNHVNKCECGTRIKVLEY